MLASIAKVTSCASVFEYVPVFVFWGIIAVG
jgi:hypothetical protein